MKRALITSSLVVSALLLVTMTGCAATATTCVSWVTHDDPQAVYDDAMLVVTGTTLPSTSTASIFGVQVPLHEVVVTVVLKGEAPEGTLLVAPAPYTCSTTQTVDSLDTDETLILLLTNSEGVWRPLTPTDGVIPLPDDGVLPFDPQK